MATPIAEGERLSCSLKSFFFSLFPSLSLCALRFVIVFFVRFGFGFEGASPAVMVDKPRSSFSSDVPKMRTVKKFGGDGYFGNLA